MKKKEIDKLVASIGIITLGLIPPVEASSKLGNSLDYTNNSAYMKEIESNNDSMFLTNEEKFKKIEEEGIRLKEEREEAERLRILEEERLKREEEERLIREEENRKANVSVDLDNVLEVSNIKVEELIEVFNYYSYSSEMIELANIIVEAEKTYGINAFIISGIASWESDYNRSNRARFDNNVLGWGVYSPSSEGINASSKYENIMNACKFLKEEYLTPDGIYFNGYSTWSLNQKYCLDDNGNPNDEWRVGVNAIAKNYEWIYKNVVK